ncbi:amiloride-sensitive sodium channel domain-containing protein [Ditylenchus destructor]|uniref:Amiloride-sensitive sodium channel domain-containing protein n=1 Tax=Ditylenchus destructor TaxID=166010 RepID=A0AAD4R7H3_9BILA|nr:amiloride-sensitive sodium channel domain-containing protein [Ditylenchus destructor]
MPDPLRELEEDKDVRAAIADVDAVKKREAELRNKTRLRRFKDTIIEWARFSSYDGLNHMALADNKATLIFWTIIVIISLILFFYLLVITLSQYLRYETDVGLNLHYAGIGGKSSFPSITICNVNPYKASAIRNKPQLQALINLYNKLVANSATLNK